MTAWVKPRSIFDIPALQAKIKDLEATAAQPEFWDDQSHAQRVLQELNEYKSYLDQLDHWQASLEDTQAILELLEDDADALLFEEAQENVVKLGHELEQWELQRLLSGTYDKTGAVLSITAGAGGTDAQDWAEMLLRMYTRWGEQKWL